MDRGRRPTVIQRGPTRRTMMIPAGIRRFLFGRCGKVLRRAGRFVYPSIALSTLPGPLRPGIFL
jgi:hypothetical protein